MNTSIRILIDRLTEKGMEISTIPAFIRNLANTIVDNPRMSLQGFDGRMRSLGRNDFELDGYTLQLILAIFEFEVVYESAHPPETALNPEQHQEMA